MTIMMEVEMMAIWKNVIALAALETTSIMMTTRLLMMATLASECDFDLAWPTFHDDVDAEADADADDNEDDDDDDDDDNDNDGVFIINILFRQAQKKNYCPRDDGSLRRV